MNFSQFCQSLPRADITVHPRLHFKRMKELVSFLKIEEKKLGQIIHIAGTNGKGSTVHYLKNILITEGYVVNTYTSPHLIMPNERIFIKNRFIQDNEVETFLEQINNFPSFKDLHFFQIMTAIAFLAFQAHPADYLLLETGLGGRYDMTNVINKKCLCIFTPIQLDHMEQLGNSLKQIALNKIGITRKNVPCLSAPQTLVIQKVFREAHLDMELVSQLSRNPQDIAFSLALRAAEKLLGRTIKAIKPPPPLGRYTIFEISSCQKVVLDVAHNEASIKALVEKVKKNFPDRAIKIIFGLQKSKDIKEIFKKLSTLSSHIIQLIPNSQFHSALNPSHLHYKGLPPLASLLSSTDEIIVICGSFQIVGKYLEDPLLKK